MILPSAAGWQHQSWQDMLKSAVTSPEELVDILELPTALLPDIRAAARLFPLRVPMPFLQNIEKGNINDPLLRQVLPLLQETETVPGFTADPLAEKTEMPCKGLLHKYRNRTLLVTTGACAIHCRYCFRRHFPYDANRNSRESWQRALDYIGQDPAINEAILSGGDPLSLPDKQLAWLIGEIAAIPHIRHIRLHTRFPVAIPQRITSELLDILQQAGKPCVVVLHCNHGNELGQAAMNALQALRDRGLTLLNQAVLLRGVNDAVDTLETLGNRLFEAGVLPYYLHLLDRVEGAAHFEVDEQVALSIYAELQARVSGFLLPRLVREIPGAASKTPLGLP